jgi:hypothetical protein
MPGHGAKGPGYRVLGIKYWVSSGNEGRLRSFDSVAYAPSLRMTAEG